MSQIQFIYFDLGNVILNFSHQFACEQMANLSGLTPQKIQQIVFDDNLQTKYETGLIDSREFHQAFCRQTGRDVCFDKLMHATSDIFQLNVSIVPLIVSLAQQQLPLGILSNTCDAHWQYVSDRFLILRQMFSTFVLSYNAKSMKPDGTIYDVAIKQAGAKPENIFFTDDKPENVAAAQALGIDATLFTDSIQLARDLRQRNIQL